MFTLDNTARIRRIRRTRQPHRSQEQQRAPKPSPTTRIHAQKSISSRLRSQKTANPANKICQISALQFRYDLAR